MSWILTYDWSQVFNLECLALIIFGTFVGLLIGALPGLGPTVGVALLLPLSAQLDPSPAIAMLVSLYMAGEYGGSITAVVMGIPGTSAAVPTCFDGYPLAKSGKPGKAVAYSLTASTIGGLFGWVVLAFLTAPLARACIRFSDPELFLIALFGLLSVSGLSSANISKTMVSILIGLLLGTIGLDTFTGVPRFCRGIINLYDGFDLVSVLIGMFAVTEVLNMVLGDMSSHVVPNTKDLKVSLTFKEFKSTLPTVLKSSVIGTICGIIPGLGGGVAAMMSYSEAKRSSKHPETFGTGEPLGIAASESANNAVVGGALLPFLTLGIPGSSTIAIISGALMMQGIQPGITLMKDRPELVYSIFAALLLAIVAMYVIGRFTNSLWARVLILPNNILAPIVLLLALLGAYASRGYLFDVWVCLGSGIIWWFLSKVGFSRAAFVLSYILSKLFESGFRRSLQISYGSYGIFISRPICIVFLCMIVLVFGGRFVSQQIKKRKKAAENA